MGEAGKGGFAEGEGYAVPRASTLSDEGLNTKGAHLGMSKADRRASMMAGEEHGPPSSITARAARRRP